MPLTVTEAKILSMAALGVGSFFIGLFPACLRRKSGNRQLLLSSLMCFGAGVLLATSMLHILPEVHETIPEYAELVFCLGFLLLYLVDEAMHLCLGKGIDSPSVLHSHSSRQSDTHDFDSRVTSHSEQHSHDDHRVDYSGFSGTTGKPIHHGYLDLTHEPKTKSTLQYQRPQHAYYGTISDVPPSTSDVPAQCYEEEETLLCHSPHTEPCANAKTALVGLLIALSLHALLEGLAIGLQTKAAEVLLLLGAVAAHKFVVGFCLGIELSATAGSFKKHAIAMAVFSGGSAIGIALGMPVSKVEESWSGIVISALQGLAGGTLLYVTVSEVLPRERARWHKSPNRAAGIVQFASVCSGFVFMFFLTKYITE